MGQPRKRHPLLDYSQNGEQPHILELLEAMGLKKGHIIELGAGDGVTMSNTKALRDKGWTADLYDGDAAGDVTSLWITLASMRQLKSTACDFFAIDIDGNDYHILRWMFEQPDFKPSLIVAEINPIFNRLEHAIMPYDANHVWQHDTWYGMSLAAAERLCEEHGYVLAYLHAGINAFFIPKAYAHLCRPIAYTQKWDHRAHTHYIQWER